MTTVLIVDDHAMFRAGVRAELGTSVDVVAEAADVDEAIAAVLEHRPDVVLLDVHLPGGGGAEVMRRLSTSMSSADAPRFLALSVSDAAEDVIGTIRAGARGYVTKTITGPELVDAIRRVSDGDAVFSPRLAGFVLDAFAGTIEISAVDEDLDRLTEREREVMRLIAVATPTRRWPRSCSSPSRPSRPTCRACCASSSCRRATSSPAGPPTAACCSGGRRRRPYGWTTIRPPPSGVGRPRSRRRGSRPVRRVDGQRVAVRRTSPSCVDGVDAEPGVVDDLHDTASMVDDGDHGGTGQRGAATRDREPAALPRGRADDERRPARGTRTTTDPWARRRSGSVPPARTCLASRRRHPAGPGDDATGIRGVDRHRHRVRGRRRERPGPGSVRVTTDHVPVARPWTSTVASPRASAVAR